MVTDNIKKNNDNEEKYGLFYFDTSGEDIDLHEFVDASN